MDYVMGYIMDNFLLITTLVAAFRWIWEYVQNRRFEKNKLLLSRIEKFSALESTILVNKMLDWNSISLCIGGKMVVVSDDLLVSALSTHDKKSVYNEVEVEIRSLFDSYFDGIRELIIMADCGLIDRGNLRKFLAYWIGILNGVRGNKSSEFVGVIDNYLVFYDWLDVRDFISVKIWWKRF